MPGPTRGSEGAIDPTLLPPGESQTDDAQQNTGTEVPNDNSTMPVAQGEAFGVPVDQTVGQPQLQLNSAFPATQPSPFSPYDLYPNKQSYLVAGVTLNESAELYPANNLPTSTWESNSVTKIYGSLALTRTDRRFNTHVDYKGGEFFYNNTSVPARESHVQQFSASEAFPLGRATFLLEESLSDYPAASFGSTAYGGASAYNLGFGTTGQTGISNFFGFNDYGGYGGAPHFTSVSLAEVTYQLTPRSLVSAQGAYAFTDYLGQGNAVNDQQTSALGGYQYQLTPRSSVFVSGGFQQFKYPGNEGKVLADTVQLGYTRSLTPRLNFVFSLGPSFISSTGPTLIVIGPVTIPIIVTTHQTSLSAVGSFQYLLRRETLSLSYERLTSGGSGFFEGATTDIVSFGLSRPLSPRWTASFNGGFARLSSLGLSGTSGSTYEYGFVGAGLQRAVGRHFSFTASYQFNDETSYCNTSSVCPGLSQSHIALISFGWHTLPFHLGREHFAGFGTINPAGNRPNNVQVPSTPQ